MNFLTRGWQWLRDVWGRRLVIRDAELQGVTVKGKRHMGTRVFTRDLKDVTKVRGPRWGEELGVVRPRQKACVEVPA